MAKKLSKIGYILPVESISRKFAPRHETCRANRGASAAPIGPGYVLPSKKWLGAATLESKVIGVGNVTKNILVCRAYGRQSVATTEELQNRVNFETSTKWANVARKDLMAISDNQAKFFQAVDDTTKRIHGVSAAGYQTMYGWMVAICMAILADDPSATLPADHKLPAFDA